MSQCKLISLITSSVNLFQFEALWEAGLLSVTVNKPLSKNTPYLAHLDKSPCVGLGNLGIFLSAYIPLYILFKDGGNF